MLLLLLLQQPVAWDTADGPTPSPVAPDRGDLGVAASQDVPVTDAPHRTLPLRACRRRSVAKLYKDLPGAAGG